MFGEHRGRLIRKFLTDKQASPFDRSCPYVPRSNDVIICGYFRSGNSWVQQILHQIRCRGEDESYDDIDRVVWYIPPYMERLDFDLNADQSISNSEYETDLRLFWCHDCYEDAPMSNGLGPSKYVVLVRDPIDVAWSEAKSRYRNLGVDKDYDFFAVTESDSSISPRQNDKSQLPRPIYYPTYWEHFLSWWANKKKDNVFWLHYEDLLKDLRFCIGELARFVGVKLTEEQIDRVYESCTYEYMRQNADRFSGEFLIKLRSGMLAVEPWRPLSGRVSRSDGARSGQGSLNLNERTKATIRWNWRQSIEKLTSYKSYSQLYAANSLLKRKQSAAAVAPLDLNPQRKNTQTLNLL